MTFIVKYLVVGLSACLEPYLHDFTFSGKQHFCILESSGIQRGNDHFGTRNIVN